jgi:hypothetical protein
MENNDNEASLEALEKEGLAWMSKGMFAKFVVHHSRANPALQEMAADDAVKPFFKNSDKEVHDELNEAGKSKQLVKHSQTKSIESIANVVQSGSSRDLNLAVKRKSINMSISTNIIDMALKHEHTTQSPVDSRSRMLSGGFVVHPDAHEDDDHESHAIVQMAITKAARRVTCNDPLMGTHSPGGRSSVFGAKHSTVMRPSGRPEKHGLLSMSKKRTETFLGGIEELSGADGSEERRTSFGRSKSLDSFGSVGGGWMSPEKSALEEQQSSLEQGTQEVEEKEEKEQEPGMRSRENSLTKKNSFSTRRTSARSRRSSRLTSGLILDFNTKDLQKEINEQPLPSPRGEFGGGLVGSPPTG